MNKNLKKNRRKAVSYASFSPSCLVFSFLLLTYSFLLIACSDPTSSGTVTFSGTVTLEGKTDHSGVTISLYAPVELDTALLRINEQYPHIGVQISQETEFDHLSNGQTGREHEPLYTTTSKADGSWAIKNVEKGEYNVVVEKKGFGRTIRYEQSIDSEKTGPAFALKPMVTLSGVYNQAYVFDNQFIEVSGDAVFETGSTVQFKGECIIHFKGAYSLTIKGGFSRESGSVIRLFADDLTSDAKWEFLSQADLTLENVYAMGDVELRIAESKVRITNSYFRKANLYALNLSECNLSLSNLLFRGNTIGLNINKTSGENELTGNVFFDNEIDVEAFAADVLSVNNNMFKQSGLNLNFIQVNALVEHNNCEKSEKNLNVSGICSVDVRNNNFINNITNIYLQGISHQSYVIKLKSNENNFIITTNYYIYLGSKTFAGDTLNAENNFWGTIDESIIQNKIIDKTDFPENSGYSYVKYWPFALTEYHNAGIE